MAEQVHNSSPLTDADWDALEEMASRLEDAWKQYKAGDRLVDLAAFLPAVGAPLRKSALYELIKVDLECRWRHHMSVALDYYVDKFPELGRARDLPANLVFEEYRVRVLHGDKPALAIYQTRFPAQFDQLQRLLSDEPLPTVAHLGTIAHKPADKPSIVKPSADKVTEDLATRPPEHTLRGKNVSKTKPVEPGGFQTEPPRKTRREVGEYRELERLGAGAFGEVWKVELPGGIMKAVKIIFRPLDHEEAKRELESLELIKGLRHHFLLQTISFSPSEDRLRILMDLADGSLRDMLKKAAKEGKKGLPLHDIARWLHEAAEALDYLHEKGVQHRDIKPENILLSEGSVRVADFGLARHQATRRLASGSGAGTPLYMPPEAWNDKQHANSDQYSLAATYAECRLGRRIFEGDGLASLMQAHVHDRPKLDPLPADEQQVLLKALAKNPDHRYPSCTAFAEDLIRAVAKQLPPGSFKGLTIVEGDMTVAGRRARQKQKQIQNVIMGGAAVAVLSMAAIVASFLLAPPSNGGKDPKDEITLPAQGRAGPFVPVPATDVVEIGGKRYYKQIECHIGGDPAFAVRFNLVPPPDKGKPAFYLMENKVSNDVYEAFAKDNPAAVDGSRWRLGARGRYKEGDPFPPVFPMVGLLAGPPTNLNFAAIRALFDPRPDGVFNQDDWPLKNDHGARNPRWPVLRVDVQEANLCAEWLGGALPSVEEWDKAAGRFEPKAGEGPYQAPFGKWEVAIDVDAPLPIGTASKDVSTFSGCRDMAGNGLEWTRSYSFERENGEYFGNLSKVPQLAKVPMRGRSYRAPEPLTFADLELRPVDLEFFQRNRISGSDSVIGFRVAVLP